MKNRAVILYLSQTSKVEPVEMNMNAEILSILTNTFDHDDYDADDDEADNVRLLGQY